MNRADLEHILRAAARIAEDTDVVVIGSQSILGSFDERQLPDAAHASIEADVAFWNDEGNEKSDRVDMHLGEDSWFHAQFGYYAQGVDLSVAVLPVGWRDRMVRYTAVGAEPGVGHCLDRHDLVVSKLVAGRLKDLEFAGALLAHELVQPEVLIERAGALEVPLAGRRVAAWVRSWVVKHRPG